MSKRIKSAIDDVVYNILCYEKDCDLLHYEIYVRRREWKLLEYELTLREIDRARDELKRLEKKYKIELRKESHKRANEEIKRIGDTIISQLRRLAELENAKDEISTEIEHVEDTYTEDPIKKLKEVENKEVIRTDQEEEETKPQLDYFQIICEDQKEEIEPQLDLYKTRGRVFSKKGRKREDDGLEGIISDDSTIVSPELKGSSHDLVMITSDNIEGLKGIILDDVSPELKGSSHDLVMITSDNIEGLEGIISDDSTTVLPGLRGSSHNFVMITGDNIISDIIEVEHIDFIIPEYVLEPPSFVDQFSKFFAPQPFFKRCRTFIVVPSPTCIVLAFYKTRGRVFSNKGSMMGNGSEEPFRRLARDLAFYKTRGRVFSNKGRVDRDQCVCTMWFGCRF